MASFILAHEKVGIVEGGYVNRSDDRGGETYAGISRKWHPKWDGWPIVDRYKKVAGFPKVLDNDPDLREKVLDFYRFSFWEPLSLPHVKDQETAFEIYEMAVNLGPDPAILIVQKALNVLNNKGLRYKDITVDGDMGPATLNAINYHGNNPAALIRTLNGLQFHHYFELCKKDPSQEVNFVGWLKRT